MIRPFVLYGAVRRDPRIDAQLDGYPPDLGVIARHWFEVTRGCGDDVREVLHDGQPTACVDDVAFAYVAAYAQHVNIGFFAGAELEDPAHLLQGTGKSMRHVKLRPGVEVDDSEVLRLVEAAYRVAKRGG